jgi:hypothetical protein
VTKLFLGFKKNDIAKIAIIRRPRLPAKYLCTTSGIAFSTSNSLSGYKAFA